MRASTNGSAWLKKSCGVPGIELPVSTSCLLVTAILATCVTLLGVRNTYCPDGSTAMFPVVLHAASIVAVQLISGVPLFAWRNTFTVWYCCRLSGRDRSIIRLRVSSTWSELVQSLQCRIW